jgi:hypothetical protein
MPNFEALAGYPVERFSRSSGRFEAVNAWVCNWADRYEIAREVLGLNNAFSSAYAYRWQSFPLAIADDLEMSVFSSELAPTLPGEALDQIQSYAAEMACVIRVTFRVPEGAPSVPGGSGAEAEPPVPFLSPEVVQAAAPGYLTFDMDWSSQFLEVPGRGMEWSDNTALAVPEDVKGAIIVPTGQVNYTYHAVAKPPWGSIRTLVGSVNSNTDIGSWEAGTMLYMGARTSVELSLDPEAPRIWKLAYTFAIRRIVVDGSVYGWNHFFRPGDGWKTLRYKDGNPLYPSVDFKPLFKFDQPGAES